MPIQEKEQEAQRVIQDSSIPTEDVISYIQNECRDVSFRPKTLGLLFERITRGTTEPGSRESCFTDAITIDHLETIHKDFRTKNGSQWSRDDQSYLGNKYILRKTYDDRGLASVRLDGPNDKSLKRKKSIRRDIVAAIKRKRCAILDVGTRIECDHKDGHYDVLENQNTSTQNVEDFQPLSKAANDAKRGHCKRCRETQKRYDATRLGYSYPFIVGDEDTPSCVGCYWFDPQRFNEVISKDYRKNG